MAVNPNSPGVYLDEIPVLPSSVAGVATAVPAFIGYVEKAERNGVGIPFNTPTRIASILEYEIMFGKAQGQNFTIDISDDATVVPTVRNITVTKNVTESVFKMYYNMQMYFANGGGPCYIVPVGLYSDGSLDQNKIVAGLKAIEREDEPTLLICPDTVSFGKANYATKVKVINDAALAQCQKLKDRFVIMDVLDAGTPVTDGTDFRTNGVSADNLKYGAAYYPSLSTALNFGIDENLLHINSQKLNGLDYLASVRTIDLLNKLEIALATTQDGYTNAKIMAANLTTGTSISTFSTSIGTKLGDVKAVYSPAPTPPPPLAETTIITAITSATPPSVDSLIAYRSGAFATASTTYAGATTPTQAQANALLSTYESLINSIKAVRSLAYAALNALTNYAIGSLANLKTANPSLYNSIMGKITALNLQLNPSGAMAGIYARVDNERGVWKAPANVGVRSITGPSVNVTNAQQDGLNVDATSGKSINVIRSFTGRGTLVWGARTLAGNDNEWRYINVRRLFNYVEESVKNATAFVVFEPNTANTWFKVKGMIEAFLTGLWRDGALAGATTKDAFFVRVGLGVTMTADDVLNGKMYVEVGMAAVRPAEFIILKFEHKLQES